MLVYVKFTFQMNLLYWDSALSGNTILNRIVHLTIK